MLRLILAAMLCPVAALGEPITSVSLPVPLVARLDTYLTNGGTRSEADMLADALRAAYHYTQEQEVKKQSSTP